MAVLQQYCNKSRFFIFVNVSFFKFHNHRLQSKWTNSNNKQVHLTMKRNKFDICQLWWRLVVWGIFQFPCYGVLGYFPVPLFWWCGVFSGFPANLLPNARQKVILKLMKDTNSLLKIDVTSKWIDWFLFSYYWHYADISIVTNIKKLNSISIGISIGLIIGLFMNRWYRYRYRTKFGYRFQYWYQPNFCYRPIPSLII